MRLEKGVRLEGLHPQRSEEEAEAEIAAAVEAALHPEDTATDAEVRRQMDGMYQRDRWMAMGFVIALMIVLPFMVIALWNVVPSGGARLVLILAGAVVATYNVASMLKMIQNYRRDRDFIYRRDVAHLRELRVARRLRRAES
jgi:hypothetical protein